MKLLYKIGNEICQIWFLRIIISDPNKVKMDPHEKGHYSKPSVIASELVPEPSTLLEPRGPR